jgi:iron(III) transport system substrate-binding protein
MKRFPFFAALMAALLSGLAAVGPATAASRQLVDAAKKEGTVVWYTTLIVDQLARPMAAAFEKKYPGIKVQYARADANATAIKIINEASAGRYDVDVFDGTSTSEVLRKEDLVMAWEPDSAKDYPKELKDPEGYWVATNIYVLTPAYNTELVKPGTEPKTYQDLLDPKWKGKMLWVGTNASTAGAPGFIGVVLASMGEDKGMAYLRKLAAQNIANSSGSARTVLDQAIAGEYPIALQIFNHHAAISAKKGAPVAWIPMNPATGSLQVASVAKHAPHPNAAKLLLDFMASEEGQRLFQKADYLPANPRVPATDPTLKPDGKTFRAIVFSPHEVREKWPHWQKVFEDVFR